MNVVEFIETMTSRPLLPQQAEFVNACYEAIKEKKQLYFYPARGANRQVFRNFQNLVSLYRMFEVENFDIEAVEKAVDGAIAKKKGEMDDERKREEYRYHLH